MKNLYEITHPYESIHSFVVAESYSEAVEMWMKVESPKKLDELPEPDAVVCVSRKVIV